MKSSKFQIPSSKETSSLKHQNETTVSYRMRRGKPAMESWPEVESQALELREGPGSPPPSGKPYDLEERTAQFGEAVVRFGKKIPRGPGNDRLLNQLVGAGTSVGANYAEASETVSRKDFKYAISRCVKEAKETRFFLRMIAAAEPQLADEARTLYREARELHLIFASMYRK